LSPVKRLLNHIDVNGFAYYKPSNGQRCSIFSNDNVTLVPYY